MLSVWISSGMISTRTYTKNLKKGYGKGISICWQVAIDQDKSMFFGRFRLFLPSLLTVLGYWMFFVWNWFLYMAIFTDFSSSIQWYYHWKKSIRFFRHRTLDIAELMFQIQKVCFEILKRNMCHDNGQTNHSQVYDWIFNWRDNCKIYE